VNFDDAFEQLIGHEGGYVNHPNDPGGETKYGISKRSYPDVDIKNLTLAEAKLLAKRDYWDAVNADAMPAMLRFDLFDTAYNSGPGTAKRLLQRAVGVAEDGAVGPLTMKAVKALHPWELRAKFNACRLYFFTTLSTWPTFGKGWARRISGNLVL